MLLYFWLSYFVALRNNNLSLSSSDLNFKFHLLSINKRSFKINWDAVVVTGNLSEETDNLEEISYVKTKYQALTDFASDKLGAYLFLYVSNEEVKLEERTCDLTDKILGEILDSVKTEMEIADSQIDNDWDLNLKSEQKIQEALEDIENKNKDVVLNNENENAPDYKAETVQTVKNNSVSEKKPGRTSTRRTGTKRASRKKV